ncbi:DUF2970 domain-containing protein [Colwellia sp. MSW7]|jgi:hypothetical protein|uniref:DUF2970 domain-containing protein n=1 Tax=Colwellia maritima TaxID=2912588 RepID=A0ABS9X470_9GAMM|nr:DUF2970 domain-containing protein [Colwellia maritima]MCI2284979.1 DUF2970 domain-containing protein [Colwellia maritima]
MSDNTPSVKETFKSVAAAFLGVQSNKNRTKDFANGKLSHFIIVGVISVVIFISILIFIVNLVLPSS